MDRTVRRKNMALPNNLASVKVYPNEYITNVTVNRGLSRLVANDEYLLEQMTGVGETQAEIDALSSTVQTQGNQINSINVTMNQNSVAITSLNMRTTSLENNVASINSTIGGLNSSVQDSLSGVYALYNGMVSLSGSISGVVNEVPILTAEVAEISADLANLISDFQSFTASAVVMVSPPATSGSPGSLNQVAVTGSDFYVYTLSGWGRVTLDFAF
jgi:hypothetical protein